MRTCTKCRLEKDEAEFRRRIYYPSKFHSWCKDCESKDSRQQKKRLAERDPFRATKHRMRTNVGKRAKEIGIPIDFSSRDIVIPDICPILGIPLVPNLRSDKRPDNLPSLDRIIPDKGYVKSNIQVISFRANRLKSDAKPEELAAVLTKIFGYTCIPPDANP